MRKFIGFFKEKKKTCKVTYSLQSARGADTTPESREYERSYDTAARVTLDSSRFLLAVRRLSKTSVFARHQQNQHADRGGQSEGGSLCYGECGRKGCDLSLLEVCKVPTV